MVKLPVTFKPGGPGHYPCQIVLRSPYDIRVYQVESTVSPEGSTLELQFKTPTHQSITQDIPVVCTLQFSFDLYLYIWAWLFKNGLALTQG